LANLNVMKLWQCIAEMCFQLKVDKKIVAILLRQPTTKALFHGVHKCFEEVRNWIIPLQAMFSAVLEQTITDMASANADLEYRQSKEILE
jgi:hypothetical protein